MNEKKVVFERPHSEQLQTAVIGSKHTVTTSHIRIIHRKFSSKPVNTFEQEPTNRGTGPRGTDERFARTANKATATPEKSQQKQIWIPARNRPPPTKREQLAEEGHG